MKVPLCVAGLVFSLFATGLAQKTTPILVPQIDRTLKPAAKETESLERLLLKQELTELSNQLAAQPLATASGDQLRWRLEVFLRAGQSKRVEQTMAALLPVLRDPRVIQQVVSQCLKYGETTQAMKLLEAHPNPLPSNLQDQDAYLTYLLTVKSPAEVDAWLESTGQTDLRFRFRSRQGTVQPLLEALREEVLKNPTDGPKALNYVRRMREFQAPVNFEWMARVCRPERAIDCAMLATFTQSPATRRAFWEMALTRPFSPSEISEIHPLSLEPIPKAGVRDWEQYFRILVKQRLVDTYLSENKLEMAQKQLVETAALKPKEMPMGRLGRLAAIIQVYSASRNGGTTAWDNEAAFGDYPEYWLERIHRHIQTNEAAMVKPVFEKALARFPLEVKDLEVSRRRMMILEHYGRWLALPIHQPVRKQEKARWCKEFESIPVGSPVACEMYQFLWAAGYEAALKEYWTIPNGRMWQVLIAQPDWGQGNERLEIVRQYEWTPVEQRGQLLALLDSIAKTGPWGKTYWIARLYQQKTLPAKSIPLWKKLLASDPGINDYRFEVWSSLLEAYSQTREWDAAEHLLVTTDASWPIQFFLEKLLVAASEAGDQAVALRLWRIKSNLDRTRLNLLPTLAESGLRQPLIDYYLKMKKEDPHSTVPEAALKLLQ